MELISALAEAQKCQEATLDEMKRKLQDNQLKLDRIIDERMTIANELKVSKKLINDIEYEKESIQKDYENLLINSQNEIDNLKKTIEKNDQEWTKLLDERKNELMNVENKLGDVEVELAECLGRLQHSHNKESVFMKEIKKIKQLYANLKAENSKLKEVNENLLINLNDVKIDLLKVTNNNDRLCDEVKWTKKQVDNYKDLWENGKLEMAKIDMKNDELKISNEKNVTLERELQDLKQNIDVITQNNRVIIENVKIISKTLQKDVKSVEIQTYMTSKDLSKYEHLDREATMLVIGLREELVAAKDDLIRARADNDEMKYYINETKRQFELSEEEERVLRLEQTVESLTDMVNKDSPRYYHTFNGAGNGNGGNTYAILDALEDVKKDLTLLKTRNWNRVVRTVAESEMPTRDFGDFNSLARRGRALPVDGTKVVKLNLPAKK